MPYNSICRVKIGAVALGKVLVPGRAAPDPLRATLAKNLVKFRLQAGLTQRALAARSGITQRRLSDIEAGKLNVTLDTVNVVARALGVDPRELVRE
jgi:DNA-binding XRE family transcriptional regulator